MSFCQICNRATRIECGGCYDRETSALRARAERAEGDKATLVRLVTATEERRDEYRDRMYAAEQQARAYREALEWYADANYDAVLNDSGNRAADALAAAEQEKP